MSQVIASSPPSDLQQGVANITDDLNVLVDDAKKTVRAGVVEVKNTALRAVGSAKENGAQAIESTGNTITAHPFKSVGIALGIGLIAGILLARRS